MQRGCVHIRVCIRAVCSHGWNPHLVFRNLVTVDVLSLCVCLAVVLLGCSLLLVLPIIYMCLLLLGCPTFGANHFSMLLLCGSSLGCQSSIVYTVVWRCPFANHCMFRICRSSAKSFRLRICVLCVGSVLHLQPSIAVA